MRHCKRFVKGFGKTRSIGADWAQVNKLIWPEMSWQKPKARPSKYDIIS